MGCQSLFAAPNDPSPQRTITVDLNQADSSSLAWILRYGLKHSSKAAAAKAEVALQKATVGKAKLDTYVPHVDVTAGFQYHTYDRSYSLNGALVSNDGTNPTVGLTATYDLQKLFGTELDLAKGSLRYSRIDELLTQREIVRSIKKAYFSIREIDSELKALRRVIGLFDRIDVILKRQRALGVYNELERDQFNSQKGILKADLASREIDLETAYSALSTAAQLPMPAVRARMDQIGSEPPLVYAGRSDLSPSLADKLSTGTVLESLSRDASLARLEYSKYHKTPLPAVYGRISREAPTMPSSDGPQNSFEVGLSFPLDGFASRSSERKRLGAVAERDQAILDQKVYEYRNSVRLTLIHLAKLKAQMPNLDETQAQTEKLLDKSFLFYAQKRLDVIATLDVFLRYLEADRLVLMNQLKIKDADADLEYLLGGASL